MDSSCRQGCEWNDPGAAPAVVDIRNTAQRNQNFRAAVWTGTHLQMTAMCIPPRGEIGLEIHPDTDQLIRVEAGRAAVHMGKSRQRLDFRRGLSAGEAVFVPCGMWHNIINTGEGPLKLSSLYAPPQHPRGTVHRTRAEAQREEK